MATKNNSATDNNVLTKSDNESNFPINFRPMPKRFMVWDKKKGTFLQGGSIIAVEEEASYILDKIAAINEEYNSL